MLVNEQTWEEFSIASYKDKLLCDVFPMDAYHLLLGRPWQFDKGIVYDGKENSISFKKDGKTFKIQSSLEEDESQSKTPSILINNGKEFIKDMRNEGSEGYAIVLEPKEGEKQVAEALPSEIQETLDKYKDIVSDGTLATLPPRRVISHQIDFVLSAYFPNKVAYKLSPD